MSALDTQVGGNHYHEGGIQPIQYIEANSLQFLEASVVKRVTRHNRATGKGRQDIEKAIHELQLLLELRYAEAGLQHAHTAAPDDTWILHHGKNGRLPGRIKALLVRSGASYSCSEGSVPAPAGASWAWPENSKNPTDIVAYRLA